MPSLPLVLHILPLDMARGAQRYARALRDRLDGHGAAHRILTLFESEDGVMNPDIALSLPAAGRARGFEPRVVSALFAAIRSAKPRVIVSHGSEPLKYLAVLPIRTKVIYYKIGIATAAARHGARRYAHSLLQRRAAWVAGVSEECLKEARTVFGVPERKLVLIPNGRDPQQFHPRMAEQEPDDASERGVPTPPVPIPPPAPTLLYVGRFVESKRPDSFLDVVERLRNVGIKVAARMVGDGPLRPRLSARAEALRVELLGLRDDVPELLRNADAFVFTSEPEGEGMPGVFVEAGLSGVPVVTTDVPGARTVVVDGLTGYIVDIGDIRTLTDRVAALLGNRDLRLRLGAAARTRCAEKFTLEASAKRWEDLLNRALV